MGFNYDRSCTVCWFCGGRGSDFTIIVKSDSDDPIPFQSYLADAHASCFDNRTSMTLEHDKPFRKPIIRTVVIK